MDTPAEVRTLIDLAYPCCRLSTVVSSDVHTAGKQCAGAAIRRSSTALVAHRSVVLLQQSKDASTPCPLPYPEKFKAAVQFVNDQEGHGE